MLNLIDSIRNDHLAIFCFDKNTKDIVPILIEYGCRVEFIVDNNERLCGNMYKNIQIVLPKIAIKEAPDLSFIIMNYSYRKDIKRQLAELGVRNEKIIDWDWTDIWNLKALSPGKWLVKGKDYYYDVPIKRSINNYFKIFKDYLKNYHFNCNKSHKINEKKHFLSICAIFKNESYYIQEWIDYHILVGIDHFFMYDNGSSDGFMSVLKPYIEAGRVTLIEWPFEHSQIRAYKDCISNYSDESNWIGFIDLDEFIVPNADDGLIPYFKKMMRFGSIWFPWMVFGSGGLINRDKNGLVIEDFVTRWDRYDTVGKCFWNTDYKYEDCNSALHHDLWTLQSDIKTPPVDPFGRRYVGGYPRRIKKEMPVYINHYVTKSLEEYKKKMEGTDVFFEENSHNLKAFYWHDSKCSVRDLKMHRWVKLLNN